MAGQFDPQSRIVISRTKPKAGTGTPNRDTSATARSVMRGGGYLSGGLSFDDFCQVSHHMCMCGGSLSVASFGWSVVATCQSEHGVGTVMVKDSS